MDRPHSSDTLKHQGRNGQYTTTTVIKDFTNDSHIPSASVLYGTNEQTRGSLHIQLSSITSTGGMLVQGLRGHSLIAMLRTRRNANSTNIGTMSTVEPGEAFTSPRVTSIDDKHSDKSTTRVMTSLVERDVRGAIKDMESVDDYIRSTHITNMTNTGPFDIENTSLSDRIEISKYVSTTTEFGLVTCGNNTNHTIKNVGSNCVNRSLSGQISGNSSLMMSGLDPVELAFATIARVYYPTVVVIGITGNIINIIVLSRKRMNFSSSNIYLLGLAFADITVLIFQTTFKYIFYKTYNIKTNHGFFEFLCVYNNWLLIGAIRTSFWITVGFTVERYIAIAHPMRGRRWCTKSRAKVRTFFGIIPNVYYQSDILHTKNEIGQT